MDDLLTYLIALIKQDRALRDIFQLAMAPADFAKRPVNVLTEDERTGAAYPRIVIGGDDGMAMRFGDDIPPQFLDGRVRLEIVTQKTDQCPEPLGTLVALQERLRDLLTGNKKLGLAGVKGQIVSPDGTLQPWTVTVWHQVVGRKLPVIDPIYKRHLTVYAVQIYRLNS